MKVCFAMEETLFNKFSISLILLIALLQMHGYKACLGAERTALLELKGFFISVSDSQYADKILTSWVDDDPMSDCCSWEQIECNATTGLVMRLSLGWTRESNSNNFDDGVSLLNMSLFHPFEELQSLDLNGNRFGGIYENKVYDSIGNFKQLEILDLGFNNFKNSILPYLNTLTSLTTLTLTRNRIKGSKIKQGLANLRNLQVLDLSFNFNFSGSLTSLGLSNFTNLKTLKLGYCGITSVQGLENLANLEVLDLSRNIIRESKIALELTKLRNLKVLDLSFNQINGSLENEGICELKNLFELNLMNNNFEGHFPQCLNNFTRLKVFVISSNKLRGKLPYVIANLTSLEYLALLDNDFEGTFSLSSLANLSNLKVLLLSTRNNMLQVKTENWLPTHQLKVLQLTNFNLNVTPNFLLYQYNLKYLDLSHNNLVGSFPTWLLQNNTKLEVLYLANNSFIGIFQLPKAKHSFLHHLDISDNNFTGKLPLDIGVVLQNLSSLDMSKNSFEGDIPYSIGEMKQLFKLNLSGNKLSGELSAQLVMGCVSLMFLDLSDNNFYGQIFPKYMNLTHLLYLFLDNNHFSGKIKDGLLSSTKLLVLEISNNMLSGHIPPWIGSLTHLRLLSMSKNRLEGHIPVQLNNIELYMLDVSENCLSGYITSSLNLSSLKHLYMQNNALNGSIQTALFMSSQLMTLDLRYNKFFGRIPNQISTHSNLRVLLLRGNFLKGPIPNQLCELKKLGIMDLSHNWLNESIPSCFTAVSFWRVEKDYLYGDYRQYYLGGDFTITTTYYNSTLSLYPKRVEENYQNVEVELVTKNRYEFYNGSTLDYMSVLDLSCNELTGRIPKEIGELQKLNALNLSYNNLSGSIPNIFSNLRMIESLDLSFNKLSGRIPPELIELNFLSKFNVSYNNLSGLIPDKFQFSTFDKESYKGNPGLCGLTINKSCTRAEGIPAITSNGGEEDEYAIDMVSFNWSFGASYVTFILGLFAFLWLNPHWRWLWWYFIDACIDWCFYWLVKFVYLIRDRRL